MRLLISQYLRLLKERNELDALLPILLQATGLTPVSRPQVGVRQNGVDIAAFGSDPNDGIEKLFLIVVKKGDLGRTDWNDNKQSVRPSLDEIFDAYLKNSVRQEHQSLPVVIWVCSSGDLRQDVNDNFVGYTKGKEGLAQIFFKGADDLAELIEKYLLNEELFWGDDRKLLRKAIALVGDVDYDLGDYHKLLLSQLQIDAKGSVTQQTDKQFLAALTRINLALNILIAWGDDAGNLKQPLFAAEKSLLWVWHAITQCSFIENERVMSKYAGIFASYFNIATQYVSKVSPYFIVEDGMSRTASDSALVSISIFRQISILATFTYHVLTTYKAIEIDSLTQMKKQLVCLLCSLIDKNAASSSPRLDGNAIDINIAIVALLEAGQVDFAKGWLVDIIQKLVFSIAKKTFYPISSDNLEELAKIEHGTLDDDVLKLDATWLVSSLAIWCAVFDMQHEYNYLLRNLIIPQKGLYPQLWHPTKESYNLFYFNPSVLKTGDGEAPMTFPENLTELREQLAKFKEADRYDAFQFSPAIKNGFINLELLACRHFRIPIPPVLIYALLPHKLSDLDIK